MSVEGLDRVLDVAATNAQAVDRDARFPEETIGALADSGLLGLTIPRSAGGRGGGPAEFLETTRALASRCASSAMIYLMHTCAAQVTLAGAPAGADVLRGLASGERLGTLAFSERGSRSHFWAPVSQIANGSISAQKSFVTSAGHASTYVVSTRPEGTDEPLTSSLYLVGGDASGVEVGPAWEGLGLRGNASAPMTFKTPVAHAELLGEAGKGLDLMLGVVLPWFQLGSGAVSVGIAEGAVAGGRRARHQREARAPGPDARRAPHRPCAHRTFANRGGRDRRVPVGPGEAHGARPTPPLRSCPRRRPRTRWRSG